MTGSDELEQAYAAAKKVIDGAQMHDLLPLRFGPARDALAMARLEMLSQALIYSRFGQWFQDGLDKADWEYAQLFGYLTRLAKFELTHGPHDGGWHYFLKLFRCYFGCEIDKLAPSIFMAAVFHPDMILSPTLQADLSSILQAVDGQEEIIQAIDDCGFFR